jgi:plastocyanin
MNSSNSIFAAIIAVTILSPQLVCYSQTTIEGTVALPEAEPMTVLPPRYAGPAGDVAPADPPVAVVYLEGSFKAQSKPPETVDLWQRGQQFRPGILPVQVGTTVSFPNGDDFYHNVFSYSKPKRFDLGRYRKTDKPAIQVFDKPGVVKLYCDIHHHMRGTILVLDTPYFTTTTTNGVYRLENLPAGNYVLKAWVNEKRIYERPVELEPGKNLHIDLGTISIARP